MQKLKIKTVKFILLYPKCNSGIYFSHSFYPFSIEFIVQCYYRLKNRKNHETLDPLKKSDYYAVLFMFIQFYKNFHFAQVYKYNFLYKKYEISFTDDCEIQLMDDQNAILSKMFEEIISNLEITDVPTGTEEMKKFVENIEKYFKENDFKNTKGIIKDELKLRIISLI